MSRLLFILELGIGKWSDFEILELGNWEIEGRSILLLFADSSIFCSFEFQQLKFPNFPIEQFPNKKEACSGKSRPLLTYEKHLVKYL